MDSANISTFLLIIIFMAAAGITWKSGTAIISAIDAITAHYQLGEAFGGMVFLSLVTNLPELAITAVAAYQHHYDLAVSNLLGGIAMQTVVLVLIDAFGVGRSAPLTLKGHSNVLILEGFALIFVLTIVMMGKQFSPHLMFFRTTPFEWIILFIWLGSIYLISRFVETKQKERAQETDLKHLLRHPVQQFKGNNNQAILLFLMHAVIILIAGWALEVTSDQLSNRFHMGGVLFGATILAFCTSLPEISTGIASAKIREYQMAVSDIFGGNAFLPVLFLMASVIGGDAILPSLQPSDMYLTGLGIILTGIYLIGMVLHSNRQHFRLGIDSIIVLVVYILGMIGLAWLL